jgi:hypothetical protein
MESGMEKEDIIELTEVVEEKPSLSARGEPKNPFPKNREKKNDDQGGYPQNDPVSRSYDASFRAMKEAMTSQVESWTSDEGEQIIQRLAEGLIPRITQERLSPEIERLKAEMASLRGQREGLSDRVEHWFRKEGIEAVERISQETIPPIAAGGLNREAEKVRAEMEVLRSEREALSRRYEEWFSKEGVERLAEKVREAIPRIIGEMLKPEIENFKAESEKSRTQTEELNRRVALWFEDEGRQILENTAREIFPQIAEKVLRQEIEKLREESRAEENE